MLQPMDSYASAERGNHLPAGAADASPRLDITVERAPVGIAHFDHTGRFLYANPQLCATFGLSREELLRKSFHEISFPEDLPHCLLMTQQLATGAIPRYALEKRFTRPDGSAARGVPSGDRNQRLYWLFAIPFVATLLPWIYNTNSPELIGIPFFYWYQMAWVPVPVIITVFVYRRTKGS